MLSELKFAFPAQPAYPHNEEYTYQLPLVWAQANGVYYHTVYVRQNAEQFDLSNIATRIAVQYGPFVRVHNDPRWELTNAPATYARFVLANNDLLLVNTQATPSPNFPLGGYLWNWDAERMWLAPTSLTAGQLVQYYYHGTAGSFALTPEQAADLAPLAHSPLTKAIDQLVLTHAQGGNHE